MKSYITDNQLRMVGKSWEIREQLRRVTKQAQDGQPRLAALLPALIAAPDAEQRMQLLAPPHLPTQKKPDRRVIAFPSS